MNYDNDMNPRARRKLPRMNTSPGAGYARRMPMPMNPPSMGPGSDVLRNFANRRGKLGSVVERPMLSAGPMMQRPPLGFMPTNPEMGSVMGGMVPPVSPGVRGMRRRVGGMMPQDMDRAALMQALSRVAGGNF
jgi:hypothetical protein